MPQAGHDDTCLVSARVLPRRSKAPIPGSQAPARGGRVQTARQARVSDVRGLDHGADRRPCGVIQVQRSLIHLSRFTLPRASRG
eukprot:3446077-Rhodomonas_salina.2